LDANSDNPMQSRKISVLFNVCADIDNYNAQSLNAREIVLRLDPARFHSTLFFERCPDTRLLRSGISLVRLPRRYKTLRILREMLTSHDLIVYIDLSPASYLYLHLPRLLRRSTSSMLCIEGTRGNLDGVSGSVRKYADYVLHHADVRTAISEFVASDVQDFCGIQPDFILPAGVDTQTFHPPATRNHAVPSVLFVGHLMERKGPHLVLKAAERIPQANFRLVGAVRDSFGEKLRRRYEELNLPNISFDEAVPQPQLAEAMRDSDVFLLPSRVEGVPKVTLEAAATGLACIVFDDYQTPSVVDGVTGFQVKTFEQMLERLRLLVHDRTLRQKLGAAAIGYARKFEWDRVAERWAETMNRVVGRVNSE
jgi:glycosyltransferase involved in cell wall biosynthesis